MLYCSIRRDEEYARNWCIYSNMVKSNQDVFNCPTAYDRQTIVLAFKKLGGDSGDQVITILKLSWLGDVRAGERL